MKKSTEQARDRIINAGRRVLRRVGAFRLTIDLVAAEARCAKGLIHYHFGTKTQLLSELLRRASQDRLRRWREALAVDDVQDAIAATWETLLEEAEESEIHGGGLAGSSMELRELGLEIHQEFAGTLGEAVDGLMTRTGFRFDAPSGHIGALMAADVTGAIIRLGAGVDAVSVEEGYALAWLGLLSLTVPA